MSRPVLCAALSFCLLLSGISFGAEQIMILPGDTGTSRPAVQSQTGSSAYEQGDLLFYGRISTLPPSGSMGVWTVAGRQIEVTDQTRLDDKGFSFRAGAQVRVIGVESQGRLTAKSITVLTFWAKASPREPPKTVKSCENTVTVRPSIVP